MNLTRTLLLGVVGLVLATGPTAPILADNLATNPGKLSNGEKKSILENPDFDNFKDQYSEVFVAISKCHYDWDFSDQEDWFRVPFPPGSTYDAEEARSLFMLGMVTSEIATNIYWDAKNPVETCKSFGDHFGPNGSIRRGVLSGTGTPK